jgi:hypothetical protein
LGRKLSFVTWIVKLSRRRAGLGASCWASHLSILGALAMYFGRWSVLQILHLRINQSGVKCTLTMDLVQLAKGEKAAEQ